MRVKEVRYERLAKVGGSYENGRIGVTIELDEGDSEEAAMDRARRFVHTQLRLVGASLIDLPEGRDD